MAKRKKMHEEHINHERWLVSYADFITLLFAFFVVMYAISVVNIGKYKVLAESMSTAFADGHPKRSLDAIQVGEIKRGGSVIEMMKEQSDSNQPLDPDSANTPDQQQAQLDLLLQQIAETLAPYIRDQVVSVTRESEWIEVDMKSSLLFGSGSADLGQGALPVLRQISDTLRNSPNEIHVEGHTDDVPISTVQFPSNWELSAARAASVVHEFMRNGVDPRRMAAIGYSEYQPVASNKTDEGRNLNRRVVLIVLPVGQTRHKQAPQDALQQFQDAVRGTH
ncbi:flagellar motor protein MotD [Methylogaea oryzae]|uniref:Flagellar motor protein MotD n=1 Tax=Methylogaea oryzae TaxID=1295382 RepID=A0A8D5AKU5_9GAMM|nr:flagellar motor protein MotD [Methylogaea oryzae]BBL71491.1 flagellar motor protein MotD [Methylogaea oryzae]